jgi:PAS domain S-box-containing protein
VNRRSQFDEMCKSEALLAAAEELANLGSWEHDLVTGLISRSANLCRMLGADPSLVTVPQDFFWTLVDPKDHEIVRGIIESATKAQEPYEYQARFSLPDGRTRILLTRGKPIVDSKNRVVKRIGVAFDVTDRAEAERTIRESEERYRDLVENSRALICTHDLSGRLLSVNELPVRILGYRPEELVGRRLPDMVEQETRDRWPEYISSIQEYGYAKGLMVVRTRTGERLVWKFHNTLRTEGVPTPIVRGMAHDITQAYETEIKLRESEALLSQAEQLANVGSWEHDFRTGKVRLSKQLLEFYKLDSDAGWTFKKFLERLRPEDGKRLQEIRARSLAECRPWEDTVRYRAPGEECRILFVRGLPLAGADGKLERSIGVVQDITERVRINEELRNALRQLLHVRDDDRRRLARELHESVGQTLAALIMSMRRLQETLPGKNTVADALWLSCHEIAQQAVREMRAISYSMHPPMLDEAGLGSALRCFAKGFTERSGIEVSVNVPENLGRQSQEIETVVFRVMQEALTNVHRHSGSRTARIHFTCEDGQLRAEVQDDGCGFPPTNAATDRHALGIGISGMRECVQQLNGTLEIESAPGRGTTIRVILPLAEAKPKKESIAMSATASASRWISKIRKTQASQPER